MVLKNKLALGITTGVLSLAGLSAAGVGVSLHTPAHKPVSSITWQRLPNGDLEVTNTPDVPTAPPVADDGSSPVAPTPDEGDISAPAPSDQPTTYIIPRANQATSVIEVPIQGSDDGNSIQ